MPVIRVSKKDVEKLLGRELSKEEILDLLPRLKCEVESVNDDIIEYEATHDRPDLFSAEGLARGLRYLLGLKSKPFKIIDSKYEAYAENIPRRPYIAFAIVKDVELDDEAVRQLMQLQEKLASTYGRNRRKASIGVYDLDKFKMPVYYELRDPLKTSFTPLNHDIEMNLVEILEKTDKGVEYGWLIKDWDKYPVIRDSTGKILSMPPIINSEDTKVTVETRNILIDSTGTDPDIVVDLVTIMAYNIAERSVKNEIYIVKTIYPDGKVVKAPRRSRNYVRLDVSKASEYLGIQLDVNVIVDCLKRMGYRGIWLVKGRELEVLIPPYRLDVKNWIDLVEDIAIAYGYDKIGSEAFEIPPVNQIGRIHPLEKLSKTLRMILANHGYVETVSYMMSNPEIQVKLFNREDEMITVSNPKMEKYTGLRIWLVPNLVETVLLNKEKEKEIKIFEIGDVVYPCRESDTGACSERRLGIAISHDKATLTDGLAIVNSILETLGLNPVYAKKEVKGLLPERTASITINNVEVGFVGEIHPSILARIGVENPVVVAEISLNKLLDLLK